MPLLLLLLALATPSGAPDARQVGVETTISFASNGGLRDWRRDPAEGDLLYVRDRTERWYQVRLTGDCGLIPLDTLAYTTNNLGQFDLFSRISFLRRPNMVCGVRSIRTSLPPADHQARRSRR